MFKLLSFYIYFVINISIYLPIYLSIYLSVYLSVRSFVAATGHSFGPILTVNGSNDVTSQPLVPFGGRINIAPYWSQPTNGWEAKH